MGDAFVADRPVTHDRVPDRTVGLEAAGSADRDEAVRAERDEVLELACRCRGADAEPAENADPIARAGQGHHALVPGTPVGPLEALGDEDVVEQGSLLAEDDPGGSLVVIEAAPAAHVRDEIRRIEERVMVVPASEVRVARRHDLILVTRRRVRHARSPSRDDARAAGQRRARSSLRMHRPDAPRGQSRESRASRSADGTTAAQIIRPVSRHHRG